MSGVTTEFCENVVEQYEPAPEAKENNFMTVDGWFLTHQHAIHTS
ncbi:unnamed protein product [Haemonchus placei]|uniref:EF-hand_like domain-containing protein n=1 Tax=Haemonchus placei TaxID=6290 RepID=A0A0N4VYW6_HAEPC|nr:unnamed protein product [Haemonchus placei]